MRAAQRAADGLLPAGRAGARGAAARGRGPAAGRERERGRLPGGDHGSGGRLLGKSAGAGRARVRDRADGQSMPGRWLRSGVGAASIASRTSPAGLAPGRLRCSGWPGRGPCDSLVEDGAAPVDPDRDLRRPALWAVRWGCAGRSHRRGAQLALCARRFPTPPLPPLGPWDRIVADYRTTGMTLGKHPMELLREELPPGVVQRCHRPHPGRGARVKVAGMVVARQRPATANGVVFMLLEDERDDQPDRAAAGSRALPAGGTDLRIRAGRGQARAPRGNDQRGCLEDRRLAPAALQAPRRQAAARRPADSRTRRAGRRRCRPRSQALLRRRAGGGDGRTGRIAASPAQLRPARALAEAGLGRS